MAYWACLHSVALAELSHAVQSRMKQVTLQWRQIEHDGVSNHRCFYSLLNRLFRHKTKKTPKLHVTGLCEGNSPVTGHKGPVTRKMSPFDDVIMDFVAFVLCSHAIATTPIRLCPVCKCLPYSLIYDHIYILQYVYPCMFVCTLHFTGIGFLVWNV